MRRSLWGLTPLVAAVVGLASLGGAAVAQQGAAGVTDEQLVDRLVAVEQQLPALPPSGVVLADDQTWADLRGDFTGAQVTLSTVVDETAMLFADADDADSEVGEAVAAVARSLLVLHQAYDHLAEWESADLVLPIDGSDDDGVATGADERYGEAAIGLELILDAHDGAYPAYQLLAASAAADDADKQLFDAAVDRLEEFRTETRPDILRALSESSAQVVAPVERFDTADPGDEARARSMTVTCVARDADVTTDVADLPDGAELAGAGDCPDLAGAADVRPGG